MKLKAIRPELLFLILAAAATRLWHLFVPNAVVFDEVYFKVFSGHYLDHNYYFDIHPPLVKLILAGVASLAGLTATDLTGPGTALVLRLVPAVAGVLLVPVVWAVLRQLGARRPFAFAGAFALLLDNAVLTESRFILMDSLLLLFGFACVWFFLLYRKHHARGTRYLWLVLAAMMGGAAVSTKWTGLTALAIVGLTWTGMQVRRRAALRRWASELAILVVVPVALYAGAFAVHFSLLAATGDGDAFMTPRFQSTLIGNANYDPGARVTFFEKFVELNHEMYVANQTLTATHPYASRWYSWPLELRPIYYWQGETLLDGRQGNTYLLGNPVVWWGVLVAALAGLGFARLGGGRLRPATRFALVFTGAAYLMNFLPFVGVTRVMFLYHYFFSFVFSIIFVTLLWDDLTRPRTDAADESKRATAKRTYLVLGGVCAAVLAGFIYFAPLTYGTPLTPAQLAQRMWLKSWR